MSPDDLTLERAIQMDRDDSLRTWRDRFCFPPAPQGQAAVYLSGNSLGLQPRGVREAVLQELEDWSRLGVKGHFHAARPWFSAHQFLQDAAATVVGAQPPEVVMMNSLSVNLHLMMVSFYRPAGKRTRILIEENAFPSDRYAVESQIRLHGRDPQEALLICKPREGEDLLRIEDIEAILGDHGSEIALVMLSAVHYFSGQALDVERITAAAHAQGCEVGFDLAHAAGNLVLRLHAWNVDFAVWCSYKYLNSGPGSVGGCFVHERHARRPDLVRLAGWWGNDPITRFSMPEHFEPQPGAAGWQVSNVPILSMAPCRVSLGMFQEVGMETLRRKSERLTGWLEALLRDRADSRFQVITPSEPDARGCQLSLRIPGNVGELCRRLESDGITCDYREPDVLRVAPVPLYNSFEDVWRFVDGLTSATKESL